MAISQRLVDPYREIQVPTSYSWQESYQAALLETDWTKMQERVQTAEAPEQRDAHPHAIAGAQVLALADTPGILDEAAVLKLHPLRRRRRP